MNVISRATKKENLRRGAIIRLKLDELDMNLGKNVQSLNRPYVVISNHINNKNAPTINIIGITKQVQKSEYPMHVFLSKDKYGLEYDSIALAEQIITINKCHIKDIIACLDNEDMYKLDNALDVQVLGRFRKASNT